MGRITGPQIKLLRTLASKRFGNCSCPKNGPERERAWESARHLICDFHQWLGGECGVRSTRQLTSSKASRAIDALMGKKPAPKRKGHAAKPWRGRYPVVDADGMVTTTQADEVARLEHLLGWYGGTAPVPSQALQTMTQRQLGRPSNVVVPIAALSNRQASTLITGLRRLLEHNRQRA